MQVDGKDLKRLDSSTHDDKRPFSDAQHGFLPGRDCATQLLTCVQEWTEMLERGGAFDVVYTDFAKTFDSLPRERLLLKLPRDWYGWKIVRLDKIVFNWKTATCTRRWNNVRIDRNNKRDTTRFNAWTHSVYYFY